MPYANNNGVKIYYEVEGEGPPMVLLHGGGSDLNSWRTSGYAEALQKNYQLILIDERGQGKSDAPHDSELYNMEYRVGDITVVLDNLDVRSAHFFGCSQGGRISLECAIVVPQRVVSLILLAIGPQGKSSDGSHPMLKLVEAGPQAFIAQLEQSGPLPTEAKARLLDTDWDAAVAMNRSPWPNLEADLPGIPMPVLIILGELDALWPPEITNQAYSTLPSATFLVLPGLNHVQSFRRSDLVLPHVKEFLASVSKT
jgi:pimeloyl-ACP methyl ester carboxylesterase